MAKSLTLVNMFEGLFGSDSSKVDASSVFDTDNEIQQTGSDHNDNEKVVNTKVNVALK